MAARAWWICFISIANCSCSRGPDAYPPPVQFTMPSGPEPAVPLPDPNRLLIAMADADWKAHVVDGVLDGPDGATYRWTRPRARFHWTLNDARALQFYMRFILADDSLHQTGAVTLAISINGHELDRSRMENSGEREYVRGVPDGWVTAGQPVTIALEVEPGLVTSNDKLGILLHSIGFKK